MSEAGSETSAPKISIEKESGETSLEEKFKEEKVEPVESLKDDLRDAAKSVLQTVIDKIDEKIEKRVDIEEKKTIDFEKPTVAEEDCVEKKFCLLALAQIQRKPTILIPKLKTKPQIYLLLKVQMLKLKLKVLLKLTRPKRLERRKLLKLRQLV